MHTHTHTNRLHLVPGQGSDNGDTVSGEPGSRLVRELNEGMSALQQDTRDDARSNNAIRDSRRSMVGLLRRAHARSVKRNMSKQQRREGLGLRPGCRRSENKV